MSEPNTETVTDLDLARLLMSDLDLARLLTFATLHHGYLPDVPLGVMESHRRLEQAGLVEFTVDEDADTCLFPATITPLGRAVAIAMLVAARRPQ